MADASRATQRATISHDGAMCNVELLYAISATMLEKNLYDPPKGPWPISVPKEARFLNDFTTDTLRVVVTERYRETYMDMARFRELLMPTLRERFDGVFSDEPLYRQIYGTAGQ